MFSLKNKVAIVTGSTKGIGKSIAIEFAKKGANVVVSGRSNGEPVVKKIKSLGRKSIFVKADMSNHEDIKNLVSETIKKFKKIDILVNNAGVFVPSPSENVSEKDWERTLKINLEGCFFLCKEASKYMIKKKKGSIINVASVAGLRGYSQAAAYCASKGGLVNLTHSLATEWGGKGIRVNSICPGIIETDMTKETLKNKKVKQDMLSKVPLNRAGKPKDIAGPAVFLASDASSYVTGVEIVVDGGWIFHL